MRICREPACTWVSGIDGRRSTDSGTIRPLRRLSSTLPPVGRQVAYPLYALGMRQDEGDGLAAGRDRLANNASEKCAARVRYAGERLRTRRDEPVVSTFPEEWRKPVSPRYTRPNGPRILIDKLGHYDAAHNRRLLHALD